MIPFHLQRLCHFPPRLMALSEDIDKRRFPLSLRYLTATFSMRPRSRSFRHRPKSIDFSYVLVSSLERLPRGMGRATILFRIVQY